VLRSVYQHALKPLLKPFARRARRFLLAEVHEELAQIHRTLDEMRASAQPGAVGSARIETNLVRSIESALITMALDRRSDQTSQNQDGGLPRDVPPCEDPRR